jgi:hypothetical protein
MIPTKPATVILSIPDTEQTVELPYDDVVLAIERGEIEPTRWAWRLPHQEWKQIAELPAFHDALHKSGRIGSVVEEPAPLKTKAVEQERKAGKQKTSYKVHDEDHAMGILKFIVFLMALAVAGVVVTNYMLIDQPLGNSLSRTPYALSPVHAHLGSFCQPGALVIHVWPTPKINPYNFADFMVTLAKSVPLSPFSHQSFDLVGITNAWTSQYLISGDDWNKLGQMDQASEDDRQKFILTHLMYTTGQVLFVPKKHDDADTQEKKLTKAWQSLIADFFHG